MRVNNRPDVVADPATKPGWLRSNPDPPDALQASRPVHKGYSILAFFFASSVGDSQRLRAQLSVSPDVGCGRRVDGLQRRFEVSSAQIIRLPAHT
jgi:hypothetical protein